MGKKWEYLVLNIRETGYPSHGTSNEEKQEMLGKAGEEGWELVAVKVATYETLAYFKREKV